MNILNQLKQLLTMFEEKGNVYCGVNNAGYEFTYNWICYHIGKKQADIFNGCIGGYDNVSYSRLHTKESVYKNLTGKEW